MPMRTCLITGKKAEISAFFRFTQQKGKIIFDPPDKKNPGRGGYVLKDRDALEKMKKLSRKLSHFLKIKNKVIIEEADIQYQKSQL